MSKLILSLEGAVLREVQLAKERTTIGRKADNDIAIDNLAVSGNHAQILTILNDSFLEDLGSTNGTLVNGQPVKKHFLQHNDLIEIGKYKMKYINEAVPGQTGQADFEKTMILRPGAHAAETARQAVGGDTLTNVQAYAAPAGGAASPPAPAPQAAAPAAAAPATGHPPLASIQVLTGPNAGKELELAKTLVTIGKPGVQVAVIARRPQGYFITHVEGANFPLLNGKTLDAQAHLLNDQDVIELAGVKMQFFFQTD